MGLFSLPSRLTSQPQPTTTTTTSMPRDPTSTTTTTTTTAHKSRRRGSHSSKSSASISSTGTTIHTNMARDSTTRTRPSRKTSSIPTYADPSDHSESSDDSTSPAIGLFPPRTRDSGSYLPPPAPTPPPVGTAPGGYSYMPVPVYKSTAVDDASDNAARERKSRRKAEKAAAAAAAQQQQQPQTALPSSAARKLIELPPARATLGSTTASSGSGGEPLSKLPRPSAPAPAPAPTPTLAPAPTPAPARPGVLQRVRVRAKQSLEHLPRVTLPQRPSITIRIPLPNITLPSRPQIRVPEIRALLYYLLLTGLLLLSAALVAEFHPTAALRYTSRATGGITKLTPPDQTYSIHCTIDTSSFPSRAVPSLLHTYECINAGHSAWAGKLTTRISALTSKLESYTTTTLLGTARLAAQALTRLGLPRNAHTVTTRAQEWAAILASSFPPKKMCHSTSVAHGAFLMPKAEKENCWNLCRVNCLAKAARGAAVAAECTASGRGRGSLGKCWARYTLPKRA